MIDQLKEVLPNAVFFLPATMEQIIDAEKKLTIGFPAAIKELYLLCNGIREGIGNAEYLFPLFEDDGCGTLVSNNKYLWNEYPNRQIAELLRGYLFFGSSSGDEFWGINYKSEDKLVSFHHSYEDGPEPIDCHTILELFSDDQRKYV